MKESGFKCELVKVCQHTNLIEGNFFDRVIDIGKNNESRLNFIVQKILDGKIFLQNTSHVIIQGDTTTSFAVSLSAFHNKIKIIHIEAGLRTWDKENPYPEEVYRKCISSMADLHFCTSILGKKNLQKEKVNGQIYVVGNTILDNLDLKDVFYGNVVPITLHRRENIEIIEALLKEIDNLAENYKHLNFIYIKHPSIFIECSFKNISVIPPQTHLDFVKLLKKSKFVITDSGGVQEESSFFRKKTIVIRKETERKEGVNTFSVLAYKSSCVARYLKSFDNDYKVNESCPYGDGNAVDKIIQVLKNYI